MGEVVVIPDTHVDDDETVVVVTFKIKKCWLKRIDNVARSMRLSRTDLIRALLVCMVEGCEAGVCPPRDVILESSYRGLRCDGG